MSKLVYLTGFSGSGKTTAAEALRDVAFRIDGDPPFSTSLMARHPDLNPALKNDWGEWPESGRNEETIRLLPRRRGHELRRGHA